MQRELQIRETTRIEHKLMDGSRCLVLTRFTISAKIRRLAALTIQPLIRRALRNCLVAGPACDDIVASRELGNCQLQSETLRSSNTAGCTVRTGAGGTCSIAGAGPVWVISGTRRLAPRSATAGFRPCFPKPPGFQGSRRFAPRPATVGSRLSFLQLYCVSSFVTI